MLNTYVTFFRPSASCFLRKRCCLVWQMSHNETWAKDSIYLFDFYSQTASERAIYSSATVYCAVKQKVNVIGFNNVIESKD